MEKITLTNGNILCPIEPRQPVKRGQRARVYPLDDWSGFDFRPQFLGEFVLQIDCNDCRWLDLTEDEQQELGDKCHRYHYCTYYRKRVYHETNNLIHNPRLYPCKECEKEKHEHYQRRMENKNMDYILEEMNKFGADGVDFVPMDFALAQGDYHLCKVIESYTKEEWEQGVVAYPKSARLYWKMVNGKKEYCK